MTIHGENATSLAAIMEYMMLPNHPMHEQAKERAKAFIEAQRRVRLADNQAMMRRQRAFISDEEWSAIVD
jgi:hypothetical protein